MHVTSALELRLREQGYEGRIVPVQRLTELQQEFEGRHKEGFFDASLYEQYLNGLNFTNPKNLPDAKSVIVVAVPRPQIHVTFQWRGQPIPVIVPPTYVSYRAVRERVRDLLSQVLQPAGFGVAVGVPPLKLLAARSGLVTYGRNNITYVQGMGSFHELVACYSDLPPRDDQWTEPRLLELCLKCQACARQCPTGAISDDRFPVRAERCLTFLNELPGDFPRWVDPDWHNSLVGCMGCQRACPENKKPLQLVENGEEFSAEETGYMLEGVPIDRLPAGMAEKLDRLEMTGYYDVLPRNLRALLDRR